MKSTLSSPLLIGTRNSGKLHEFQSMLSRFSFDLRTLNDFPHVVDVAETGQTFEDNAILKAHSYSSQTGLMTIADDSGLEVFALGGAPGILSARYAGHSATDEQRIDALLADLASTGDVERRAQFICVIAIYDSASNQIGTFRGKCEGRIAIEPQGLGGFGYDPIFIPDGFSESFGILSPNIKQKISHRSRALAAASAFMIEHFDALT